MQFLSPWTAVVAAAFALPALLLLYFLKLRRQTLRIPSTLLWRKSFEDLQVNAPFQRLRWSVLLALQLLMLAALLLALSEPLWREGGTSAASRVVILIDRSASMNAPLLDDEVGDDNDLNRTRFDAARLAATDIIDSVGERGGPSQAMIIGFGATAQVVSGFEGNRGVLRDALNSITSTDEQSNLEAALNLASAFAGTPDEAAEAAGPPPEVVLISDGNVSVAGDTTAYALRGGDFRFVQIAADSLPKDNAATAPATSPVSHIDNLGIVSLGARRDFDDPARVVLFSRLLNASTSPIDVIITIAVDAKPVTTIRTRVPAATADSVGESPISHALDLPSGGVITLSHNHRDQLAADDVAAIVVPPPAKPRIALISPDDSPPDPYLYELLQAMEPEGVQAIPQGEWSRLDPSEIDGGTKFDLVVFDHISNQRLPGVPSITFGGVPAGVATTSPAADGRPPTADSGGAGSPIMSWDRQHPVMRNLALDSIVYAGFGSFDLPEAGATPLAWGPTGPIIALVRTRGARHVVVGFALRRSNWSLHVSSAMFVQNALEFLTIGGGGAVSGGTNNSGGGLVYRPGEAITVRAEAGVQALRIEGGSSALEVRVPTVEGEPDGRAAPSLAPLVTLPAIPRAGLYSVVGARPPNAMIAVSMLSDVESDIRPRDSITVNAKAMEGRSGDADQPLPLWPWLLAAAFVFAVLEWLAYCRKVA